MRVVVLLRLVVCDADLGEHLVLLHALHDHRALEIAPQVDHRHVLGLERGLELLFALDLVFLPDVLDDALELLVAQLIAELLAALDDHHLVDRIHHDLRRDLVEHFPQLCVRGIALQIERLALLPERGDLTLLEVALGEDFAVHLDEDLLDDVGPQRRRGGQHDDERQ